MTPYTVILLRPDYLADNFGLDTYTAHVFEESPEEAIFKAQNTVFHEDHRNGTCANDASDYAMVLVFAGHHAPIRNGNLT